MIANPSALRRLVRINIPSVICLAVALPAMAWADWGVYQGGGQFRLISDGFRTRSAMASVLVSSCSVTIGFVRTVGSIMFVRHVWLVQLLAFINIVCQGVGTAVVR